MRKVIENVFISGYDQTVNYEKYDVVKVDDTPYPLYFVSVSGNNSGTLDVGHASNASWKRFDDVEWNFSQIWTPSYQTALNLDLKPKLSPFGDGYAQKVDTSIFFNRLSYEMSFDTIDDRQLKSLVSFFEYKAGADFFKIDINPFITGRKFVGKNWKHTYTSDNINSFSTSLFEFISDSNV